MAILPYRIHSFFHKRPGVKDAFCAGFETSKGQTAKLTQINTHHRSWFNEAIRKTVNFHKWFKLGILWIAFSSPVYLLAEALPTPDTLLSAIQQQLSTEQSKNKLMACKLKALQQAYQTDLSPISTTKYTLQQAEAAYILAQTECLNVELTLKAAQLEVELTQQIIQDLQRRGVDRLDHSLSTSDQHHAIQAQRGLLELQQKRIRILQRTLELAQQVVTITQTWCGHFKKENQRSLQQLYQKTVHDLATQLKTTQESLANQISELTQQLQKQVDLSSLNALDSVLLLQTLLEEEKSQLIHLELNFTTLQSQLKNMGEALKHNLPLNILTNLQRPLENLLKQVQVLEELLGKKASLLQDCYQLVIRSKPDTLFGQSKITLKTHLQELIPVYQQQLKNTAQLNHQAQSYFLSFNQQLHTQLSKRQALPGFNLFAWLALTEGLIEIPELISGAILNLYHLTLIKLKLATWWKLGLVCMLAIGWGISFILLKRLLNLRHKNAVNPNRKTFSSVDLITSFLHLLETHLISLISVIGTSSCLRILGVPFQSFSWLVGITTILFSVSITLQLIHLPLTASITAAYKQDIAFYRRLKWTITLGGIVTSLSLIAHKLGANYGLQALLARSCMLFLLITAITLLKNWKLLPQLLEEHITPKKRYLKQIIRWMSLLLPASLLLNASLGLLGYVQLAWAIAFYQGLLLLALVLYFLFEGLLNELVSQLSEKSIRRFRNGWLWSEALLKPLHQALKLLILGLTITLLFSFFGWNEQLATFSIDIQSLLYKKLFTISEASLTISILIQLGVALLILAWITRWTREFAYRWLFAEIKDLGLRNSLSVFAQYTAIASGILITLYTVGITLEALKWILGGLSFGIGFGLRDIFNNFVTGILLLIERPVKIGDWVTVGSYEGQVTHIGARSITLNTEDHQELLVPNADLFSKPFLNWTRHDSIVRVTIPITVNRKDDPFKIRELILEVLNTSPKILNHPSPEVYFKETDKILLEFKIEYYLDINRIISRSEVRSQVLFEIWKCFQEAKISTPEATHNLHIQGNLNTPNRSLID
jgi:potassium-dependent mechanosensitive channel